MFERQFRWSHTKEKMFSLFFPPKKQNPRCGILGLTTDSVDSAEIPITTILQ